jgi:hypothetical protein
MDLLLRMRILDEKLESNQMPIRLDAITKRVWMLALARQIKKGS